MYTVNIILVFLSPSHYHPPSPPPLPVLSNLTSHLLSLTYMFPPREETEA